MKKQSACRRVLAAALALAFASHGAAAPADARQHAAFLAADAAYRSYARGAYDSAAEHAIRAAQLQPQRRDYWLLLARARLAEGRLPAAADAALAAARATGSDAALAGVQAELLQAEGRHAAQSMYEALARGDLAHAIRSGRIAVALAPADPAYRTVLVHALLSAQEHTNAQRHAAEGLVLGLGDASLQALHAHALHHLGFAEEGAAAMEGAVQIAGSPESRREQLLLAADLALAQDREGDVPRLLQSLPQSDDAAQARRDWSAQRLALPAGSRPGLALPSIDCARVGERGSCEIHAAMLPPLPGHAQAALGYAAMERQAPAEALVHARFATEASPAQREWWRLRMRAASAAGDRAEAEAAAARADAEPQDRLQLAYLSLREGDDEAGLRAFRTLDARRELPPGVLLDAAYAAVRAGRDGEALAFFDQAAVHAAEGTLPLAPQPSYEARRSASEVGREWGVLASLSSRNAGGIEPGFGALGTGGADRTAQAGVEAYWRPLGYRGSRYIEVFARGFATLDAQQHGAWTGSDSFQGAVGARWKPLAEHDLVFSASRVFGRNVRDAWLAQAAYSLDIGGELRQDVASWWTSRNFVEAGRYLGDGQHAWYAVAGLTAGRSWRLPHNDRAAVYPHLYAGAEHRSDDPFARTSSGIGVGVSLRQWFREDASRGPHSWWELTMQYRHGTAGDKRISGPFIGFVLSY